MTVVSLRPDSTIGFGGTFSGAASAHAAMADDSDSSYAESTFDTFDGSVDTLTVPAGAVLKTFAIRTRVANLGGGRSLNVNFRNAGANGINGSTSVISWPVPTTFTALTKSFPFSDAGGVAVTDASINAGHVELSDFSGGGGTGVRVYELYVDVTYVEQPELAVTGPTGTITDTNAPRVDFTATLDADGGNGTQFQERIFTAAQYGVGGFDPATSTATASATVTSTFLSGQTVSRRDPTLLADGTYRAYVRVAQTVNGSLHWSDWEYTEFDIDVAIPASPILIITNDPDNGRIIIVIDDPGGGDATTDYFELRREKIDSPIFGYEPVRQLEAGPIPYTGPGVTVYDYEAPNGASVQYQARALHDYSGALAGSDWTSHGGEWQSSNWWLKHPNRPNLNIPVTVHSFQSLRRAARQGVFQALGALRPVIVRDTRGPITGQITFRCDTRAAQDALDLILAYTDTLLLQGPVEENPPGYIDIGDHERQRWVDLAKADTTREILEFTVVARPPGDVVE